MELDSPKIRNNFSDIEIDAFFHCFDKYRTIIESKVNYSLKSKATAWENVLNDYLAMPGVEFRTEMQLRNLYKNLKTRARKNQLPESRRQYLIRGESAQEGDDGESSSRQEDSLDNGDGLNEECKETGPIVNGDSEMTEVIPASSAEHPPEAQDIIKCHYSDSDTQGTTKTQPTTSQENIPARQASSSSGKVPNTSFRKRKNRRVSYILPKGTDAEKFLMQEEHELNLQIKEDEHRMRQAEHEIKMKILMAKLEMYRNLAYKIKTTKCDNLSVNLNPKDME